MGPLVGTPEFSPDNLSLYRWKYPDDIVGRRFIQPSMKDLSLWNAEHVLKNKVFDVAHFLNRWNFGSVSNDQDGPSLVRENMDML